MKVEIQYRKFKDSVLSYPVIFSGESNIVYPKEGCRVSWVSIFSDVLTISFEHPVSVTMDSDNRLWIKPEYKEGNDEKTQS